MPALEVLEDEGYPLPVVVDVEKPRHGQVRGKVRHSCGLTFFFDGPLQDQPDAQPADLRSVSGG